jgi:predicted glycosyltransferase
LFKNFIAYLKNEGHECIVVIRDKDVTRKLMEYYKIEYECLSSPGKGLFDAFKELISRTYKIIRLHKKHSFDYAFGTSVSIGFLTLFSRGKVISYNLNEDDDAVVPLYCWLAYPFSTFICNPDCLKFKRWKKKRLLHNSYHELAYLHPDNFSADKSILNKYNLKPGRYIIARFSALTAHHDVNAEGISKELWTRIESLLKGYEIVKSIENASTHTIEPQDMHHILAFAKMVVSDSQTMTIEAAVLGIPALRINTFIGKSTVIDELEKKYSLAVGIQPGNMNDITDTLKSMLEKKALSEGKKKLKRLFQDKCDLNKWIQLQFNKMLSYES